MEVNPSSSLFRPEAIAHATDNLLGKVLVIPKLSVLVTSGLLFIWLMVAAVWLGNAQYSRQVTVQGWLEPDVGMTNHFATLNNGVVSEVLVTPGQQVEMGQPLIKLVVDKRNMRGETFNHLLQRELLASQTRLLDDIQRQHTDFANEKHYLLQRRDTLSKERVALNNIEHVAQQQSQLAKAHLTKIEQLHTQGWVSDLDLNRAREKQLQLDSDLSAIAREKIQLAAQDRTLTKDLSTLPSRLTDAINIAKQQLADVNQQLVRLESAETEIVFAQVAGKVSDIYVHKGKINTRKPLLTIVPNSSQFIAMLPVPAHAVGFIEKGQELALRYDAFPHEKYGLYWGTVSHVSDSIVLPHDLPDAGTPLSQPVFMVKATLKHTAVNAYNKSVPLKSGNTFSADIEVGERTVIEWLLSPILSLKGRL